MARFQWNNSFRMKQWFSFTLIIYNYESFFIYLFIQILEGACSKSSENEFSLKLTDIITFQTKLSSKVKIAN